MPDNAKANVAYAAAGLIVGGLLVYGALSSTRADDEERPPIIVRGGSLIFESGDATSTDPAEKTGKPWTQVGSDWQPDHGNGNKTKWFSVELRGGNPSLCPGLSMTKQLTIVYQASSGGAETSFVLSTKPRPAGSKAPAPAISGSGLTASNTGQNPTLTYGTPGQGSIARIQFQGLGANVNCPAPSGARIWQLQ